MHESKRDRYIRLIECYLKEDVEKNGISFTHAAAKEILELLEQTDKKSGRCMIDKYIKVSDAIETLKNFFSDEPNGAIEDGAFWNYKDVISVLNGMATTAGAILETKIGG